ncbi:MAG: DKNYY domain-containing protein, partial [Bacillota bacterium]
IMKPKILAILILLALLVVVAGAYYWWSTRPPQVPTPTLETASTVGNTSGATASVKSIDDTGHFLKDSNPTAPLDCVNGPTTKGMYFIAKGAVLFGSTNCPAYADQSTEVEGADPQTFFVFNSYLEVELVAKDKNGVYVRGQKVSNADPATFVQVALNGDWTGGLFKDKGAVYVYDTDSEDLARIAGADAATFTYLARYNNEEESRGVPKDVPLRTITFLKDKSRVYFMQSEVGMSGSDVRIDEITGADPASFTPVDFYHAKDKNKSYLLSWRCPETGDDCLFVTAAQ